MDVGTGDAAVQDVSEYRDFAAIELAAAVADGERVQERLRGVLVEAVASIDYGHIHAGSDELGGARGTVAHDDCIGLHCKQRMDRIHQRFALFQAGGFGLEIHGVRAEARGGGGKTDPRARRGFEKEESDSLAPKRGEFLERMALEFLKRLRLIQQKGNLRGV